MSDREIDGSGGDGYLEVLFCMRQLKHQDFAFALPVRVRVWGPGKTRLQVLTPYSTGNVKGNRCSGDTDGQDALPANEDTESQTMPLSWGQAAPRKRWRNSIGAKGRPQAVVTNSPCQGAKSG